MGLAYPFHRIKLLRVSVIIRAREAAMALTEAQRQAISARGDGMVKHWQGDTLHRHSPGMECEICDAGKPAVRRLAV